jgi:chromosome segregation ATPase
MSKDQVDHMNQSITEYQTELSLLRQNAQTNEQQVQQMNDAIAQYSTELDQISQETAATGTDVQQRMADLQQQHQTEMQQLRQDLEQDQATQLQGAISDMDGQYQNRIRQETEQLVRRMEQEDYSPSDSTIAASNPLSTEAPLIITEETPPVSTEEPLIITPENPEFSAVEANHSTASNSLLTPSASVSELITHLQHPDSHVRQQIASNLGHLAATQGMTADIERAIPTLEKLSQDVDPQVRQQAIAALGNIKSEKVIPTLQKSLRDVNPQVVQSASAALNKFKSYSIKLNTKDQKLALQKVNLKQQ